MPVIAVEHLTKRYGDLTAVSDVSFTVPEGEVFGFLGPNGSGKTTTMAMLLGLVRPTSGRMSLFDRDVTASHDEALKRVGAVVEIPSFYPYLSGRDNLRYFQGITQNGGAAEVAELLELVHLSERAHSRFSTYSMGMKQRLGIAYALLGDPDLIFLDEPTNGLDPAGMAEVRGLIRDLKGEKRTVVLSSHLLNEVEQVCDSVAILSRGRLIAQGAVADLLRRQDQIQFKTTNDEEAAAIVRGLPWVSSVTVDDKGNLVATAPADRAWEITATLAQQRVYVVAMAPVQESLERYFLEVTSDNQGITEETAP